MTPLVDARRTRATDAGMWLFLASLVMFYASLYSGYVLLRAGSEAWSTPWLSAPRPWQLQAYPISQTIWIVAACVAVWRWRVGFPAGSGPIRGSSAWWPALAALLATLSWMSAVSGMLRTNHGPAASVAAASWFVLTGALALGVLGGGLVAVWWAWRGRTTGTPPHALRQLQRYWGLMLTVWLSIVIGMYVV